MYKELNALLDTVIEKGVVSTEDYNKAILINSEIGEVLNKNRFTTEESGAGFKEFCNTLIQTLDVELTI